MKDIRTREKLKRRQREGITVSFSTTVGVIICSVVSYVSMSIRGVWYCVLYILCSRTYTPRLLRSKRRLPTAYLVSAALLGGRKCG